MIILWYEILMRKFAQIVFLVLLLPFPSLAGDIFLPGADKGASIDVLLSENALKDGEDIKATPLYRNNGSSVHLVQIRRSERPHVHMSHDLIVMLKKGKGVLHLDGKEFEMREGDAAFISKGSPHWFENTGDGIAAGIGIFVPAFDGKDIVPASEAKK